MTDLESSTQDKYWLLKAEPDSRVVKGKDVKVSQKKNAARIGGLLSDKNTCFLSLAWKTLNASRLRLGKA